MVGTSIIRRFEFSSTPIKGLVVSKRKPIVHDLGFFERLFCNEEFQDAGLQKPIVQMNYTMTRRRGAVRGLHFQHPPHAEIKIVTCLKGEVFDVAVDLRRGSPTFLRWHGEVLSAENHKSLYIPEGFAHGFQALTNDCEMLYLHTAAYAPQSEGGVHGKDPRLAISWPLPVTEMSDRDNSHEFLNQDFVGLWV